MMMREETKIRVLGKTEMHYNYEAGSRHWAVANVSRFSAIQGCGQNRR